MSSFSAIIGQDAAVAALRQAYLNDRLPHGLIFAGPAGVGKFTTARALASLFLCEAPRGDKACGKCESCRAMEAAAHPDFHVITKELIRYHDKTGKSKGIELSINVVRPELIEPASRKAVMGRGKVFVVEQAELMNSAAQNALLKTLEEPAGRAIIILLTDQAGVLLPTIRSRCRTISFAALSAEQVTKELIRRGIDRAVAADAASLTHGSIGRALKWIEDEVIAPARALQQMLDAGSLDDLPGWFRKAADAYAEKQLTRDALASKDQATREGLAVYLAIAADHLRQRLTGDADAETLHATCESIDAIARAEQYLEANVNIPVVFQQLTVALTP